MTIEITDASHLDHGLTVAQIEYAIESAEQHMGLTELIIHTVELPERYGTVPCGLHGPVLGDDPVPETEVVYEVRGSRNGPSRLVDRTERQVRTLTIIAGPHEGKPWVLYTAFGGPVTPREPFDVPNWDGAAFMESQAFWASHALTRKR
jgi:hypothetical protein